jgi:hypothetical protein
MKGEHMKRTAALMVTLVVLGTLALPATAAAKGKMTHAPACSEITRVIAEYEIEVQHPPDYHALDAATLSGRSSLDLCVDVAVVDDGNPDTTVILQDLNVALIDYPEPVGARDQCGYYTATERMKEGSTFGVGFDLDGFDGEPGFCGTEPGVDVNRGDLTLMVWTVLQRKSDPATLHVRVGFGTITP